MLAFLSLGTCASVFFVLLSFHLLSFPIIGYFSKFNKNNTPVRLEERVRQMIPSASSLNLRHCSDEELDTMTRLWVDNATLISSFLNEVHAVQEERRASSETRRRRAKRAREIAKPALDLETDDEEEVRPPPPKKRRQNKPLCCAWKKDGSGPCGGSAIKNSLYCMAHDPASAEARKINRSISTGLPSVPRNDPSYP